MNGRKPYEGICTEAEMLTLIENIDRTPDIEWDDYEIDGEKLSYPMWKIVTTNTSYDEYLKYFDAAKKNNAKVGVTTDDEKVGIVEPDDAFEDQTEVDVFTESTSSIFAENIIDKMKKLMSNNHVVSDNTGVVKPKLDGMPDKKTSQITSTDSTKESTPDVTIAKAAPKAGVGVVKPSDAFNTQTKVDITDGKGLTKSPNQLSDKTGIVKPQSEFGGKTAAKTTIDASNSTVEIKDAPKSAKPSVGMIKPDSDIKPKNNPISFKDFLSK
jgi:hypothetical protein